MEALIILLISVTSTLGFVALAVGIFILNSDRWSSAGRGTVLLSSTGPPEPSPYYWHTPFLRIQELRHRRNTIMQTSTPSTVVMRNLPERARRFAMLGKAVFVLCIWAVGVLLFSSQAEAGCWMQRIGFIKTKMCNWESVKEDLTIRHRRTPKA